jgi:hypothetical protein
MSTGRGSRSPVSSSVIRTGWVIGQNFGFKKPQRSQLACLVAHQGPRLGPLIQQRMISKQNQCLFRQARR